MFTGLGQEGGDEENGVGVMGGCLDDVSFVEGQVFAQQGDGDGLAGGGEVLQSALEEVPGR